MKLEVTIPWTTDNPPQSWKNLPQDVLEKAVEIGNALLDKGMEEGRAIPIALSQARDTVSEDGSEDLWVVPQDDGMWGVREEGEDDLLATFERKSDAVDHAVSLAKDHASVVTVQKKNGQVQDRQSFRSRL